MWRSLLSAFQVSRQYPYIYYFTPFLWGIWADAATCHCVSERKKFYSCASHFIFGWVSFLSLTIAVCKDSSFLVYLEIHFLLKPVCVCCPERKKNCIWSINYFLNMIKPYIRISGNSAIFFLFSESILVCLVHLDYTIPVPDGKRK